MAGGCCLVALVSMQEQEVLQYLSAKRMRDTGQQGVFSDKARAVPRGSDGGADEPVLGSGKELGGLEMAAAAAGTPAGATGAAARSPAKQQRWQQQQYRLPEVTA